MDAEEREALAGKLDNMADWQGLNKPLRDFDKGVIQGLKMAACTVRDNHPKEDDE